MGRVGSGPKGCSYLTAVRAPPLASVLPVTVKGHPEGLARDQAEHQREESRSSRLREEEEKEEEEAPQAQRKNDK